MKQPRAILLMAVEPSETERLAVLRLIGEPVGSLRNTVLDRYGTEPYRFLTVEPSGDSAIAKLVAGQTWPDTVAFDGRLGHGVLEQLVDQLGQVIAPESTAVIIIIVIDRWPNPVRTGIRVVAVPRPQSASRYDPRNNLGFQPTA